MKYVAIVGSISKTSYNRKLIEFIKRKFSNLAEIEILDISGIPIFNQNLNPEDYPKLKELNYKIIAADGVIIVTPEHNYTMPAVLKSTLEWLSFTYHPFTNKACMILGASYSEQGSSRAQEHLRQVLNAPGVDAIVMPGSEFLLSNAKEKFDENDNINDERTIDYTEHCLLKFIKFTKLVICLDLDDLETEYMRKEKSGAYKSDDPNSDGTSGASEY